MKKFVKTVWLAGLACCVAPMLATAQGRVQIGLSGMDSASPIGHLILADQTRISRADGAFVANQTEAVRVSDTISNSAAGKAHMWSSDDSLFAVGPDSALRVNQYVMPTAGNPGVIDLTLERGGFRSIAGALGQGGNQYRVQTQSAQLDVKGADFWAIQCSGDCYTSDKKPLPDGLFVGVNSGSVRISNSFGSLDLGAGQFARVASPAALIKALPPIYARFSASFIFVFGIDQVFEPIRIETFINLNLGSPSAP